MTVKKIRKCPKCGVPQFDASLAYCLTCGTMLQESAKEVRGKNEGEIRRPFEEKTKEKTMERQEKAIEGGLRAWLLVLLVGNLVLGGGGLYSGIYHAVQMGISDHPLLQIATGIICILNVLLIYFVFRQKKWSAYALVAGLGIASVLFALSVWASAEPGELFRSWAPALFAIIFVNGLVITIITARVLRPVIRLPSRQMEPGEPASDSTEKHDDCGFDTAQ